MIRKNFINRTIILIKNVKIMGGKTDLTVIESDQVNGEQGIEYYDNGPVPAYCVSEIISAQDSHKLVEGFTFKLVDNDYIVIGKLEKGGEGYTYAVKQKNNDKIKVLKIISSGISNSAIDLETRLSSEFFRINKALQTNYTAFSINMEQIAVISDFIEGRNLEHEMKETNKVFSQQEIVDILLQITENYLSPIHTEGLVHRDIKPANIIVTNLETADGSKQKKYSLIDFGCVRDNDALATLTGRFVGTLGYSRIKGKYETSDDFYSLSKTAYFLSTGKHPEFIAINEYDKMQDEKRIAALNMDVQLKDILLKMLGHNNKYSTAEELLHELKNYKEKSAAKNNAAIALDVKSARIIADYKEASQMPESLKQKISGIKALFKEKYDGSISYRNPLTQEFLNDLDNVLIGLGYRKELNFVSEKHLGVRNPIVYVREKKNSQEIEVLHLKDPSLSRGKTIDYKISDYFDYLVVDNLDRARKICAAVYWEKLDKEKL